MENERGDIDDDTFNGMRIIASVIVVVTILFSSIVAGSIIIYLTR